jgi:ribose 5-phosphate isomerase B
MKIYLASDHAGFGVKEETKKHLKAKGIDIEDCGAYELNPGDDYPDFISKAAKKVAGNKDSKGIVFGKSGAGECITANKIKGIRAVVGFTTDNVRLSREHNDSNILCIGSLFVDSERVQELIEVFLNTPFSNEERHIRRINKINSIENK